MGYERLTELPINLYTCHFIPPTQGGMPKPLPIAPKQVHNSQMSNVKREFTYGHSTAGWDRDLCIYLLLTSTLCDSAFTCATLHLPTTCFNPALQPCATRRSYLVLFCCNKREPLPVGCGPVPVTCYHLNSSISTKPSGLMPFPHHLHRPFP